MAEIFPKQVGVFFHLLEQFMALPLRKITFFYFCGFPYHYSKFNSTYIIHLTPAIKDVKPFVSFLNELLLDGLLYVVNKKNMICYNKACCNW